MTPETPTPPSPSSRRRFGTGALVLAALASAGLAVGGTLLVTRRGAHDHGEATAAAAKAQYQCPMHPTIVQDHPGDCPICGMKLVQIEAAAPAPAGAEGAAEQKPQYQCPMHPSIV